MLDIDIAKAMEKGDINGIVPRDGYYLVNMRITGTGIKERENQGEKYLIDRNKDFFLSAQFLQECHGLPITVMHPEDRVNQDNFQDIVIGAIFYPYVKEDVAEVWGVSKIYNENAIDTIFSGTESTSPHVVSSSLYMAEDKPYIEKYKGINHLAIVDKGFWDTKNPAIETGEDRMDEEKKDDMSKEAKVAESERDDRIKEHLEELFKKYVGEREKDKVDESKEDKKDESEEKKDSVPSGQKTDVSNVDKCDSEPADKSDKKDSAESEIETLRAELEALKAGMEALKSTEKKEGEEFAKMSEEHEELDITDELVETEEIEEGLMDVRDSLYEGIRNRVSFVKPRRRMRPTEYKLVNIRKNTDFLNPADKEIALTIKSDQKNTIERVYSDMIQNIKKANIKESGLDKKVPVLRREGNIVYDDNFYNRLFNKD